MKLLILIGDAAVGKMTVGQELMKQTGLRLFHNHMMIEPVLEIFGASMTPTLGAGQYVVAVKDETPQTGDIIAFYYGNKVLVKRCIAGPGTWVDIREDGTVLLNGTELDEPYLTQKHFGICDLELPYQVPEGTYFLMGDERETSVDSRHSSVGCIAVDQIVGKIVYRVWPLDTFGPIA